MQAMSPQVLQQCKKELSRTAHVKCDNLRLKSRGRIAFPKGQDRADCDYVQLQQGFALVGMLFKSHFAWQQTSGAHVRFGSKADIGLGLRHVCFTPKSGHQLGAPGCPLSAKSRHQRLASSEPGRGNYGSLKSRRNRDVGRFYRCA